MKTTLPKILTALCLMLTLTTQPVRAEGPAPLAPRVTLDARPHILTLAAVLEAQVKAFSEGSFQSSDLRAVPTGVTAWARPSDAPQLRALLSDADPVVRALAAQALGSLDQIEDIPRIARLLADTVLGPKMISPSHMHIAIFDGRPSSPLMEVRQPTVAMWAGQALYQMTLEFKLGNATPQSFQAWWALNSDAKNSVWYWRKEFSKLSLNVYWPLAVRNKLSQATPETEAKVLLTWDNSASRWAGFFTDRLRLSPDRLMELLEGTNLWPDVDWTGHDNTHALIVNLTRQGSPILQPQYTQRIAAVLAKTRLTQAEQRINLLSLAYARSLATPALREAALRHSAQTERYFFLREEALAELVRTAMPSAAEFILERYLAEPIGSGSGGELQTHAVLQALGEPPFTPDKRRLLCNIVLDARFTPHLTNNGNGMGDDLVRRYALWSLNAHADQDLIRTDSPEERALRNPATSAQAVAALHKQVRALCEATP